MVIEKRNRIYKNITIIIIFLCGIGIFIYSIRGYIVFFYKPSEVIATTQFLPFKKFRIGGVVESSIIGSESKVQFYLSDEIGSQFRIVVHFEGKLPIMFRDHQLVIAEGFLRDGIFFASKVFVKHDEVYKAKEIHPIGS